MYPEPTPLVSGVNGESDPALTSAELARRCQAPAPTERIGGADFSLWKVERPLEARPPRFSRVFLATVVLGSLALLLLGRWVAERTRAGDLLAAKAFGIALLAILYLGPIGAMILRRRRPKTTADPWSPPGGVPPGAVAFLAGSRARGRSVGWLAFERDLMVFRGAGFDFRLRREDFTGRGKLLRGFRGGASASLRAPKGITNYGLRLTPGRISGAGFVADPKLWKDLESAFASWESGTFTSEPSLFPPVRPVPTTPTALSPLGWIGPPLFMAALLGVAGLLLPIEPAPDQALDPPVLFALVGFLFGLMFPFLVRFTGGTAKALDREADRAARQDV